MSPAWRCAFSTASHQPHCDLTSGTKFILLLHLHVQVFTASTGGYSQRGGAPRGPAGVLQQNTRGCVVNELQLWLAAQLHIDNLYTVTLRCTHRSSNCIWFSLSAHPRCSCDCGREGARFSPVTSEWPWCCHAENEDPVYVPRKPPCRKRSTTPVTWSGSPWGCASCPAYRGESLRTKF